MNKKFYLLSLLFFILHLGFGQIVISHDIDFNDKNQFHQLQTSRGDVLVGQLQSIKDDSLFFTMLGLKSEIGFHFSEVQTIWVRHDKKPNHAIYDRVDKKSARQSQRAVYPTNNLLYTSTAFPYEYSVMYRNRMVLWNQVDFKIDEHISAGAGLFLPVILSLRVQGNLKVTDLIRTGVAINHFEFLISGEGRATHPHAILTVGDPDKYLNFGLGYWIRNGTFFHPDPFPTVSLGGSYNFSDQWRFYAEAMAIFEDNANQVIPSFVFAHYKKRRIVELGLIALPETNFPLFPYLGYSYLF